MLLIAVDGPSGSGKTTYARSLGGVVVPTDHFATWDDPVAWWPRLVEGVLEPLWRDEPAHYQRVEWVGGEPKPGEWITFEPPEVLVLEGVSSARRAIADRLDLAVWVEVPSESERLERAVARDGEDCRIHLRRWQDFERGWFAVDGTKARADRVILR
ncbi:hypothetical protein KCV87_19520 [Actinosynnema pretiosum subsp. pretiosum]|uniref:(d)CMP kinase n=2 Tax=Actinosynnema TaxID=40566 RepID=C6WF43_ACTMD|nr:hypothetical protein [Actinosynnema mirum]ACU34175.1 hypothetical protein Amir_0204 [Actinosynnema mirum DSM 43827]AXX27548.1 hypothetical protein APASM_0183 [Actinosynnema pretiosum subsp. pretiosum]QUF01743.1 hypothetical protein KCV87_19520 [Actinosynnema pretiosum subsp. pretiosum]